eukprot:CAMPEP_0172487286 /NCGR_PEP_ID=MMETSP1066-20121228/16314_1 /TAXON_ID=671091 /ORGANISM="Coscinodiscus wailesii, Strain CCMP2513" /LENGTH=395 /DNA_ID=CAMNT_0013253807 /DNA_START=73 /DNA_END=1260 /DNA_ORIENTATION=-
MELPPPIAPPLEINNDGTYHYSTMVPPPPAIAPSHVTNDVQSPRQEIDKRQLQDLKDQGFTTGLAKSLFDNVQTFPLRIWILDNSGSMAACDGHRFVETRSRKAPVKMVSCTRWNELQETVEYHARIAGLLRAPTTFRLLNDPGLGAGQQEFSISQTGDEMIPQDIKKANDIMRRSAPRGITPLTSHIHEIRDNIVAMQSSLVSQGKKVAVIIATDGLPTDEYGSDGPAQRREFVDAIRSLERLPIWVVIRLCTDDDHVVEFYNELDSQLEMSVEVLDDFVGEAKEVQNYNRWLNYTLPLHRCREMGFYHRLFDLLDERKLTRSELREFCRLLFGEESCDGVPDPEGDWNGFMADVKVMLGGEKMQYDPIKGDMRPVIDVYNMDYDYGEGGCVIL